MSDSPHLPEFDDEVVRAMARWPDVPQCFGWLGLDRRGAWRIRGEIISHERAVAFLGRHYRSDAEGRWFVQNGPQQVFVELDYTPWIYRYDAHSGFTTHTGLGANELRTVVVDDEGNLLVESELGIGLVDDRDLAACAERLDYEADEPRAFRWHGRPLTVIRLARQAMAARWGYVQHPAPVSA
ncbi:MAG: DUF2946 family protein [Gammaproteobacteria bacterium]